MAPRLLCKKENIADPERQVYSAARQRKNCVSLAAITRSRRFLQGGDRAFFIDNMGAMRYYYKVLVCLFPVHTTKTSLIPAGGILVPLCR